MNYQIDFPRGGLFFLTFLLPLLLLALVTGAVLKPVPVMAWGPGHDYQGEILIDFLPKEINDFLAPAKDTLLKNVHYPDSSFQLFSENPQRPGGFGDDWREELKADLKVLAQYNITNPYALHSARGKAVSFILLTRAFREKNPVRAGLWLGALCHAVGDESAFNHGPLIHYLTCAFQSYGIAMGEGIGLELISLKQREDGRAQVEKLKPAFVTRPISDNPEETLVEVMMSGVRGNDYMVQREKTVATTCAVNASPEVIRQGLKAMAEVGLFGARETADMALTAWQYAREGKEVVLTEEVSRRFQEQEAAYLQAKPLENDSIFAGLLEGVPGKQVVGVLLEPSQTMNQAMFSFGAKYILAGVMSELKHSRIPYQPLDIRRVGKEGLPLPSRMPVIIVCAGSFEIPGADKQQFRNYAKAGGRFIWIGGRDTGMLGKLSGFLVDTDDNLLPVSRQYGDTPNRFQEVVSRLAVTFTNEFAPALGNHPYRFHNNPNTEGGWQKPVCTLRIEAPPKEPVLVLATITKGDQTINIAGALMEEGRARYLFLPEYLLSPYLLSGENSLDNPETPVLDTLGKKVLVTALTMTVPELIPPKTGTD